MKPNIVFIISDDQGAWALGCGGNSELKTPTLDSLAANGVRFDNFFCASPVCSPARASIFTGTMPSAHGIQDWLRGGNVEMSEHSELKNNPLYACEKHAIDYLGDKKTFVDILSENGYRCALSGKWHMGDSVRPQHGFSKWYTIARGGCDYFNPDIVENGEISFKNEYITDLITENAVKNIREFAADSSAPFYLSVHYTAPHSPWNEANSKKEYWDLYSDCPFNSVPDVPLHPWLSAGSPYKEGADGRRENLQGYYAAISAMDSGIAEILSQLKVSGVADNTIVIFTSDNGMNMGHHGIWGKGNGTFPQNMYDSSVKIPFIVSCPALISAGAVNENLHSHYDIFPTLMDYLGIAYNKTDDMPGKSFAEILRGEAENENNEVVIFDEYGPVRMIRTRDLKYVCRLPYGPDELYDLANDPDENINLAGSEEFADVQKAMRSRLFGWFAKYASPDIDASREFNTGYGQLQKVGIYSDGGGNFAEEEAYREAYLNAINKFTPSAGKQPGT